MFFAFANVGDIEAIFPLISVRFILFWTILRLAWSRDV
jgi:hypothetical protein